jgi:RNA binding exosome subunit
VGQEGREEDIMLFHRLSLEAFCHATEDLSKVQEAMSNLVPFEAKGFKEKRTEGSFGNEIIVVTLQFSKQAEINKIIEFLKPKIAGINVEEHIVDDSYFWIRFDKQKALEKEFVLGGQDTIQLKGKVAAFPAKKEKVLEIMKKAWV